MATFTELSHNPFFGLAKIKIFVLYEFFCVISYKYTHTISA